MVSEVFLRGFYRKLAFVLARVRGLCSIVVVRRASNGVCVLIRTKMVYGGYGIVLWFFQVAIGLYFRGLMDDAYVNLNDVYVFRTFLAVGFVNDEGYALFRFVRGSLGVCGLAFAGICVSSYARGLFCGRERVGAVEIGSYRVTAFGVVDCVFYCFLGDEAVYRVYVVGPVCNEEDFEGVRLKIGARNFDLFVSV